MDDEWSDALYEHQGACSLYCFAHGCTTESPIDHDEDGTLPPNFTCFSKEDPVDYKDTASNTLVPTARQGSLSTLDIHKIGIVESKSSQESGEQSDDHSIGVETSPGTQKLSRSRSNTGASVRSTVGLNPIPDQDLPQGKCINSLGACVFNNNNTAISTDYMNAAQLIYKAATGKDLGWTLFSCNINEEISTSEALKEIPISKEG